MRTFPVQRPAIYQALNSTSKFNLPDPSAAPAAWRKNRLSDYSGMAAARRQELLRSALHAASSLICPRHYFLAITITRPPKLTATAIVTVATPSPGLPPKKRRGHKPARCNNQHRAPSAARNPSAAASPNHGVAVPTPSGYFDTPLPGSFPSNSRRFFRPPGRAKC